MNWLWYLLEANLYVVVFYGFYLLFLQRETFYTANRFYLIVTSLISFLLPILQLGILKPTPEMLEIVSPLEGQDLALAEQLQAPQGEVGFSVADFLLPIYLLFMFSFIIKLGWDIFKILKLWFLANRQQSGEITIIELKEESAFSFFNLLFVHPRLATKTAVIIHEMVHIAQKHSFDILLFEVLQTVSWFNPVFYFLKKDIKLIHEFIADELSAPHPQQKHEYAMFLIENSFGISPTTLANQFFNQSILKRRINMLNKKRTVGRARLKLLLALPLTAGMLCMSTMAFTKDYGYVDLLPEKSENTSAVLAQVVEKAQEPATGKLQKIQVAPKKGKKQDVVMFPPPVVRSQKNFYYPPFRYNETTKKREPFEVRHIVINGQPITDRSKFYGVTNTKEIVYLDPEQAKKKYGKAGTYGALEITGDHVKVLDHLKVPPAVEPPKRPKKVAKLADGEKVEEISIAMTKTKKVDVEEISIVPLKAKQEVVEIRLLPTKKEKLDSVTVIEMPLEPRQKKKLDSVKVLRILPTKKLNKKVGLNGSDGKRKFSERQQVIDRELKTAVEAEINAARKTALSKIATKEKS